MGTVLGARQARERHFRSRRELARAGQPCVHLFEVPASVDTRERCRKGKALLAVADFLAHRAIEVGADAIGAALVDGVARRAFGEFRFALRGVGRGEQIEIGSASVRERLCQYVSILVVAVSLKKKNNMSGLVS